MMYYDGFGWLWMLLWMAALVIIIGLVVWAVIAATRRGGGHDITTSRTPLDIAKERYARGEITREEFEQLKRDLL